MAAGGLLTTVPTPGFFHLDLFIQDTKDVKSWYDDLKRRLDMEKGAMENAMTNLLSVFAFHKVRGKGEARKLLETLTRKEVDNLNAIANKQFIYGQLMRTKDEMACRDRLQELLADKSDAARARNARCFAEQGYALEFVREDSKDMVSKIKNAISLFETALNLVCDTDAVTEEERLVWKYYMSKCYWRLDQVVSYSQDQALSSKENRLATLLEAQRCLIEVTKMNPSLKQGGFYVARAWALLGALEDKCSRGTFGRYETPGYLIHDNPCLKEFGPQFGCYKKALEINPNDFEIYRRFGECYRRNRLYDDARKMLDRSINIMPDSTSNWLAYFHRSLINKNQYDQLQKQVRHGAPLPPKQLLRRAKEDAVASCDGAMTKLNIHHLGKVCHRLAINPATERVEDREELGDALDNFAQALLLDDGYTDPRVHADMARSLEATGEHEKAAESYKRAVENDDMNATFTWNLTGVQRNLLKLHGLGGRHTQHLIAELAFWINEGYKKYRDITGVLQDGVFKFGSQMIKVCQYLLDHGNFQLAMICLECFQGHRDFEIRNTAAFMMSKIPGADDNGASGAVSLKQSQTEKVNLPVAVEKPRHGQEFQYDFFVSHSSKDADWVDFALLPAMEADLGFKGCVADRDFVPGKSVFDNIIYSIENSYKTLLILTPNFVTSEWCKYETQQALMESLKSKTGRVIPIMLRDCQVPASVRTITYLDVSRDAIGSYDWMKLKKALEERPPTEEK